jgi:asparagine N-glycosylation enzyme membrane subunit Stt3
MVTENQPVYQHNDDRTDTILVVAVAIILILVAVDIETYYFYSQSAQAQGFVFQSDTTVTQTQTVSKTVVLGQYRGANFNSFNVLFGGCPDQSYYWPHIINGT